jgi:hypothetical protein
VEIKEGRWRRKRKTRHGRTRRRVRAPGTSGDRAPIRRSLGRRRNLSIPARGRAATSPTRRPATGSRAHEDTGPSGEPVVTRALGFAGGLGHDRATCAAGVRVERGVAVGEKDRCARAITSMPACPAASRMVKRQLPVGLVPSTPTTVAFVLS